MKTHQWTQQIESVTREVRNSFSHLSTDELNQKPSADVWSIAQILEHIIIINESYYSIIKSVKDGSYKISFMGKMPFMVSFIGNAILKGVSSDNKKKTKTFPIWEPSKSNVQDDIINRFEKHQMEFSKMIQSCEKLIEKNVVINSPANKHVVYKLSTAFDIIVAHEERHLLQAKNLLNKHLNCS